MTSFVYFDLGGVTIQDFSGNEKGNQLKIDLGLKGSQIKLFDQIYQQYAEKYNFSIDYDIDNLIPVLEKTLDITFPKNYSLLVDIVNRLESNPSIWPVIEKVAKNSHIGLLTNMFPRMLDLIKKRNIIPPVSWDVIVDSSVVGLQKPDPNIFVLATKLASVSTNEILFIDNSEEHIASAHDFGWKTFLYDSTNLKESSVKLSQLF
ncbi:MAG: HAD family hydrolase [Nanoarchaeota archaeon]|nr:HAD family hydrolase [Nanoarchaeota archaeon]